MAQTVKLGVVILAGGEGQRMGGDKPFRRLAGRTLFEHVQSRVQVWQVPVAVSVRDPDTWAGKTRMPLLVDGDQRGPIAGIVSALGFAATSGLDAVLTVPCDTPFLPDDLLPRLTAALVAPGLAALAESGGRMHPSCALWSVSARRLLPAYLASGRSLLGFAEGLDARIVEWPDEPFDPFLNINTPADLAAADAILKRR